MEESSDSDSEDEYEEFPELVDQSTIDDEDSDNEDSVDDNDNDDDQNNDEDNIVDYLGVDLESLRSEVKNAEKEFENHICQSWNLKLK